MQKKLLLLIMFSILFAQNNITNDQIDLIKEQLLKDSIIATDENLDKDEDSTEEDNFAKVIIDTQDIKDKSIDNSLYFGYEYFQQDLNFFDNFPTPSDYTIGAGDEIILSLWGEVNSREKFIVDKNGSLYFENLGFINISNMTLNEAEKFLKDKLQNIYSTLKTDVATSDLTLEVSKLKSLNIYLSGEVENPGIHLVHPFSDIFSALIQSGGPTINGSLREIQLIRDNKIISTIDLYSFFNSGVSTFSTLKIVNGDVINIPPVKLRVLAEGEFVNPGYFELLTNESLDNLLKYSGGLTAQASSTAILEKVIPIERRNSDDNAIESMIIGFNSFAEIELTNGSKINIPSIGVVDTKVEVLGQVKTPGMYPAGERLFDILTIAGGFDDPIFRKTIRDDNILVLRKNKDDFYGLEYQMPFEDTKKFVTVPGDKIFVYENTNYDNSFSIEVTGEVKKRGFFPHKEGMTVSDVINLAEGFTDLANEEGIVISQLFTALDGDGNEIVETIKTNDVTMDFVVSPGSKINILSENNVVNILGNVYSPGLVSFSGNKSLQRYIKTAGGLKPNTLRNKIYVQRANGRSKQIGLLRGYGIRIRPGDTIVVPENLTPSEFDVTAFTADILAVLSNLAAILVIVDNSNN